MSALRRTAEGTVPLDGSAARIEADLAAAARGGCRASYGELVARFEGRLFNFVLRRTRSHHDAEDLTQEAFIRAWERIHLYDPRWRFSTWLFTIAARLSITHGRRNARRGVMATLVEPPASSAVDPARRVGDDDQCRHLWDVADTVLSETQRAALWLQCAEDLAPREIARILGKSRVAVRVMLFRARAALAAVATTPRETSTPVVRPARRVGRPAEPVEVELAGGIG